MSGEELVRGYWRAYREFYRWRSIARGAAAHESVLARLRHLGYAAGWKKFEPLWHLVIRARRVGMMLPFLEAILSEFGKRESRGPTGGAPILASARVDGGSRVSHSGEAPDGLPVC
jgi:hypothetical protein